MARCKACGQKIRKPHPIGMISVDTARNGMVGKQSGFPDLKTAIHVGRLFSDKGKRFHFAIVPFNYPFKPYKIDGTAK